jgi:uncharacterized membrane protein
MKLERNWGYWLLVLGASLWCSAVLLAPAARAAGWPIAEGLYGLFRPICHQLPDRSFVCFKGPLAACHRCFGLYLGFLSGLLLFPYLQGLRSWILREPIRILLFFAPMLVDVALGRFNQTWDRFATGWLAGFPVSLLLWAAAAQLTARWALGRKESYESH